MERNTSWGRIAAPFSKPIYITAKPAGENCNLRCAYCYYEDKGSRGAQCLISDKTLEEFVRQYIECQAVPQVLFIWHGGEPMLRSLAFYRRVLELQNKYAKGKDIDNCIQTNGTLITDEWCRFLKDNGWLVGLSVDGPETLNDINRKTKAEEGSFRRIMKAVNRLERHGVEWNAMATVNKQNVGHPLEFYNFFKSINSRFIQFTPIVERYAEDGSKRLLAPHEDGGKMSPESISPKEWGTFLCSLFDEWIKEDVGEYFIQIFEAFFANWLGVSPGLCSFSPVCGQAGVMEYNGDVYSCDHFVFPKYKLGNIFETPLASLMYGEKQTKFGNDKYFRLPKQCKECEFLRMCYGECPKNRFATSKDGEKGLNYLCEGYRMYFSHLRDYMESDHANIKLTKPY